MKFMLQLQDHAHVSSGNDGNNKCSRTTRRAILDLSLHQIVLSGEMNGVASDALETQRRNGAVDMIV